MYICARFAWPSTYRDPVADGRKLLSLLRYVEKATAAFAQHFSICRVYRVEIASQLTHHTSGLQPRRPMWGKSEGQGVVPAEFNEGHVSIITERTRHTPVHIEKFLIHL